MNKIIIPTDFSAISRNSVIYGFQLAAHLQLEVNLLHVVEIYKYTAGTSEAELLTTIVPTDNINELEQAAIQNFQNLISEINSYIKVPYKYKVTSGYLANELLTLSSMPSTELIMLAVAEKQDLLTRFTNSTIASIINDAVCPVIVIPSACSFKPINNIAYATDYNKFDLTALKKLLSLFGSILPAIDIVHILNKDKDFKEELKFAGFKQIVHESINYPNITFNLHSNKNVVNGIIDCTHNKHTDLLVMIKQHEGFFSSLFETSKTDKISHHLTIPMISYTEQIIEKE